MKKLLPLLFCALATGLRAAPASYNPVMETTPAGSPAVGNLTGNYRLPPGQSFEIDGSLLGVSPVLTVTGDAAGSATFTNLTSQSLSLTLANVITAGSAGNATYGTQITYDAKGRIIGMATVLITPAFSSLTGKPTTLSGYGITDAQPLNSNLTTLAGLASGGFGRTLLGETSAANARTDLGLGALALLSNVPWANITSTPTSANGYGIANGARLDALAANISATGNLAFANLTSTPTTLAGYGITDALASNWAGSTNLTTLGTVTTGNWNAGNIIVTMNGGGTTPGSGVTVQNLSSAALGAQQQTLLLDGITQGWNNSSNASKQVEWKIAEEPVQGNPVLSVLNIYARSADVSANTFKSVMQISMKNGFAELVSGADYSLTWNGSTIGTGKGGTSITSYTTGDIIYASASSTLSKLGIGSTGQTLIVTAGLPAWGNVAFANLTGKPTTISGYGITDAQGLNSNLTTLASLASTTVGQNFLTAANPGAGTWFVKLTGNIPGFRSASTFVDDLGAGAVGKNFFTLGSTSSIKFPRINADDTISQLDAGSFLTAIGGQTLSANLTTLAGVTSGTFGRTLLAEATAASVRTDLGLGGIALLTTVDLTSNVTGRLPAANLANTTVTAGTYGNATTVPQITVDAQGRLTGVSNVTITGGGGGGGTGNNQIAFTTGNFDKTDDSLADITGLSLNLVSGTTYSFRARLHCVCDPTDGIKIQMGGTCSVATVYRSVYVFDLDTFANSFASHADQTSLSGWTSFTGDTNVDIIVEGTIVCNGNGTLTMQAAENASSGGTTATVLGGSTLSTLAP